MADGKIDETVDKISKLGDKTSAASESVQELSQKIGSFGEQIRFLDALTEAGSRTADSIKGLDSAVDMINNLSEGIAGLDVAASVLNNVNSVIQQSVDAAKKLDAPTESFRVYTDGIVKLGNSFGMTYEQSKALRDEISKMAASSENAEYYFSSEEITRAAGNLLDYGVAAKNLSEEVNMMGNSLNMAESALFMSAVTGDSLGSSVQNLKKDMYDFGMSLEDSMLTFAGFQDTASKTGLSTDTVRTALVGAASGVKELGVSIDFAKPFLEGFVESLEKVGVGIENATNLASSMSRAVTGLMTDYGKAYFTFQQGGLDFGGGGGVLGAGIGFRAKMLEAEKSGEQGEMALEVAGAIKKTIENFTGGEIITVDQAANNPELQQLFAVQESILKDYGISGAGQVDRTLELLKDLDDSQNMSKEDLNSRLEQLNDDTKTAQEQSLSEEQKTNSLLSKILTQNTLANDTFVGLLEISKASAIVTGAVTKAELGKLDSAMSEARKVISESKPFESESVNLYDRAAEISLNISENSDGSKQNNAEIMKELMAALERKVEVFVTMTPKMEEYVDASASVKAVSTPGAENSK